MRNDQHKEGDKAKQQAKGQQQDQERSPRKQSVRTQEDKTRKDASGPLQPEDRDPGRTH